MLKRHPFLRCVRRHPNHSGTKLLSRTKSFEQTQASIRQKFSIPDNRRIAIRVILEYADGSTHKADVDGEDWESIVSCTDELVVELVSNGFRALREVVTMGSVETNESDTHADDEIETSDLTKLRAVAYSKKSSPDSKTVKVSNRKGDKRAFPRRQRLLRYIELGRKCDHCEENGAICKLDDRSIRRVRCRECYDNGVPHCTVTEKRSENLEEPAVPETMPFEESDGSRREKSS